MDRGVEYEDRKENLMSSNVSPIPAGYTSVTPHLTVDGAAAAIDFYTRAFGAVELFRWPGPDGKLMHVDIRIGNAIVMLNDPFEGQPSPQGPSAVTIHLYVDDADATFANATAAGAQPVMPLDDMPWGDRYGIVADPFGLTWAVATRKEDVSDEELAKRMSA
jgi:PhnB protein